jgi:hypothetical protein
MPDTKRNGRPDGPILEFRAEIACLEKIRVKYTRFGRRDVCYRGGLRMIAGTGEKRPLEYTGG